jgi:hypothetical protein
LLQQPAASRHSSAAPTTNNSDNRDKRQQQQHKQLSTRDKSKRKTGAVPARGVASLRRASAMGTSPATYLYHTRAHPVRLRGVDTRRGAGPSPSLEAVPHKNFKPRC